jgi:hypothetical protein
VVESNFGAIMDMFAHIAGNPFRNWNIIPHGIAAGMTLVVRATHEPEGTGGVLPKTRAIWCAAKSSSRSIALPLG